MRVRLSRMRCGELARAIRRRLMRDLRMNWRENFFELASVISGGTCQKENRDTTRKCLFGGTAGCAAEPCCGEGNGKDARGDLSRTRKDVSQSAGFSERKSDGT